MPISGGLSAKCQSRAWGSDEHKAQGSYFLLFPFFLLRPTFHRCASCFTNPWITTLPPPLTIMLHLPPTPLSLSHIIGYYSPFSSLFFSFKSSSVLFSLSLRIAFLIFSIFLYPTYSSSTSSYSSSMPLPSPTLVPLYRTCNAGMLGHCRHIRLV